MIKAVLLLLVLFQFPAWAIALDMAPSAWRDPDTKSSSILARELIHAERGSALQRRRPYNRMDFSKLPHWTFEQMMEAFVFLRDLRFVQTEERPDFLRRLSWLYPDDGCSTRAGFMSHLLFQQSGLLQPMRIFVFGDLKVETANHPRGQVTWWYHTALVLRVDSEIYVLDPSLSIQRPLTLEDWLYLQVESTEDIQLSLCLAGAYSPRSLCDLEQLQTPETLTKHQSLYLKAEWSRQLELKRNPEQVLGDDPPWLQWSSSFY